MKSQYVSTILQRTVTILCSCICSAAFPQTVDSLFFSVDTLAGRQITLPCRSYTSFVVETRSAFSYTAITLVTENMSTTLVPDEELSEESGIHRTTLFVFPSPTDSFTLRFNKVGGIVKVIMVSIPPLLLPVTITEKATDGEPQAIDQSVWRTNVADPSYTCIFSDVKNIIIHHSETWNSLTDYASVVRNIYVYHTRSNGWSDIGYNYLVAPDGTIFKGRDPGLDFGQDEVQGAHFCKANAGTMGICVIGNYNTAEPTAESLDALTDLLAWKCKKNNLDPGGTHPHVLNDTLRVIDGHRLGCTTTCPGQYLYDELPAIRQATLEKMGDMATTGAFRPDTGSSSIGYRGGLLTVSTNEKTALCIVNTLGCVVQYQSVTPGISEFSVNKLSPGIYFCRLGLKTRRIIAIN